MNHRKIERPKVFVEREISEVVVDVEEKGVSVVLWRLTVSNPVQLVYRTKIDKKCSSIND